MSFPNSFFLFGEMVFGNTLRFSCFHNPSRNRRLLPGCQMVPVVFYLVSLRPSGGLFLRMLMRSAFHAFNLTCIHGNYRELVFDVTDGLHNGDPSFIVGAL